MFFCFFFFFFFVFFFFTIVSRFCSLIYHSSISKHDDTALKVNIHIPQKFPLLGMVNKIWICSGYRSLIPGFSCALAPSHFFFFCFRNFALSQTFLSIKFVNKLIKLK